MRSLLTLLGITIGVFAVVTMFSTVYGLKTMINEKMGEMGWNNSLIIYPSSGNNQNSHRKRYRFWTMRRETKPLTFSDYTFLNKELDPKYIYGSIQSYQTFFSKKKENFVRLTATNNDFFHSKTYRLKKGRFFNSYEDANAEKVCILGHRFVDKYFKNINLIDEILTIGKNRFKVIGILDEDILNQNGMNFSDWERRRDLEAFYIPLSTGSRYFRNNGSIDQIYMQAKDENHYDILKTKTTQKLLSKHNMTHDFAYNDVGDFMLKITKEINEMMKKWNITLSAIASISLIVGGIGLFSTLLISINERMKEIGIRKSIGATNLDIFLLFILEAIILALIGALIGIIFSSLLIVGISAALKFTFPIPVEGILLGLTFSVVIGIFSGLFPAIKASKIDPIEAIYYFE